MLLHDSSFDVMKGCISLSQSSWLLYFRILLMFLNAKYADLQTLLTCHLEVGIDSNSEDPLCRLQLSEKIVIDKVVHRVSSYYPFKNFGKESNIGDWTVA